MTKYNPKAILILIFCLALSSCSQFAADRLVVLPPNESIVDVNIIDLRPDNEKTRTDYSGKISVADDRQFTPSKLSFLTNELSKVETLTGKDVQLLSFKHTLDTSSSTKSAMTGGILGPVGIAIGGASAPEGGDSIRCTVLIKIDGTEFTSSRIEYFKLGSMMAIEWEKPQLRSATSRVTQECVEDIVAKVRSNYSGG